MPLITEQEECMASCHLQENTEGWEIMFIMYSEVSGLDMCYKITGRAVPKNFLP